VEISCHSSALIESGVTIGNGTTIWVNCQVRTNASIGCDCTLGKDVFVDVDVKIGDRCKIQNGAQLFRGVTIGDEVFIGPVVVFTNDREPRATGSWELLTTIVDNGASVGANSTIICGVRLGEGCMVGAGSVVTRDVMPFSLVVGNPARHVRWLRSPADGKT